MSVRHGLGRWNTSYRGVAVRLSVAFLGMLGGCGRVQSNAAASVTNRATPDGGADADSDDIDASPPANADADADAAASTPDADSTKIDGGTDTGAADVARDAAAAADAESRSCADGGGVGDRRSRRDRWVLAQLRDGHLRHRSVLG